MNTPPYQKACISSLAGESFLPSYPSHNRQGQTHVLSLGEQNNEEADTLVVDRQLMVRRIQRLGQATVLPLEERNVVIVSGGAN